MHSGANSRVYAFDTSLQPVARSRCGRSAAARCDASNWEIESDTTAAHSFPAQQALRCRACLLMLRLLPLVQPRELAQHFYGSASLPSTSTWPPRTSQSTISQLRDSESKAPTLEELTHSSHRGWRQASGPSPMLPCAPRPHEAARTDGCISNRLVLLGCFCQRESIRRLTGESAT